MNKLILFLQNKRENRSLHRMHLFKNSHVVHLFHAYFVKKLTGFDGPEVHVYDGSFSCCLCLLRAIIIKFQWTTSAVFNSIKLQMIKCDKFMAYGFEFVSCRFPGLFHYAFVLSFKLRIFI